MNTAATRLAILVAIFAVCLTLTGCAGTPSTSSNGEALTTLQTRPDQTAQYAQAAPTVQQSQPPVSNETQMPVASVEPIDLRLADAIRNGATMEEIAKLKDPSAKTPEEAVRALKLGNSRFFSGQARRPGLNANQRRAQILTQTPFAAVLGCSDSRVPIELVYDQGLGDIFAVRVAGNVIEPGTTGSIEYAVEHLKSHVIVVMGHEGCGAVAAAMLSPEERSKEAEGVRFLLDLIVPSVSQLPQIRDDKARMREAVVANVRQQVAELKKNRVVQEGVRRGQIVVIGAYYEISSGAVDFLETDEQLRVN